MKGALTKSTEIEEIFLATILRCIVIFYMKKNLIFPTIILFYNLLKELIEAGICKMVDIDQRIYFFYVD